MSSDNLAIKVTNVSKTFKLPHERKTSLKSLFVGMFSGKRTYEKQQVLDNISFEVKQGEFFGIVGRNGSGKSTLLKLMAGIYAPDKGKVGINGTLTPFIELGVGFNPELTGRENVFLNGALLGFSRKEIFAMYDEIVEFAELEKFMDQKLKNYSSGMQVRLAFSIAIRAKSDVLLLDEVLAVGDAAFQQKCYAYFNELKSKGQTVILVTHDMSAVETFCSRALLLDSGTIIDIGTPRVIATKYSNLNMQISSKKSSGLDRQPHELSISLENSSSKFEMGDMMKVNMTWPDEIKNVRNAGVAIIKSSGEYIYGANTLGLKGKIKKNTATYQVELNVGPGKYYLKAGIFGETAQEIVDFVDGGPEFIVSNNISDQQAGLVRLKDTWTIK